VITVSTSRYRGQAKKKDPVSDESGDVAKELVERAGGKVVRRGLVPDDAKMLRSAVSRALREADLDVIVLTGGTGVSTTDLTIETVRPLFEKEIEGFGEIFRFVSFQKIGAAAALSRATAGVSRGKVVMCLPGSPDGVRTALELFLGEVPHVLHLARGA
jgi:molybdenum cofactor biosynthesis protein B